MANGASFRTMDTVVAETPHSFATSRIVIIRTFFGRDYRTLIISEMPILKGVFQRELNLTVVGRRIGDGSASGHVDCNRRPSAGQSEIWVIPKIEEL